MHDKAFSKQPLNYFCSLPKYDPKASFSAFFTNENLAPKQVYLFPIGSTFKITAETRKVFLLRYHPVKLVSSFVADGTTEHNFEEGI